MPLPMPRPAQANFHLLAKPTGAICNLDCKYCFFLSKEMLYPGSRFRMADELLETYIRQLLESQPGPEVIVGWQGGEPTLMGLDFFQRSVELRRALQEAGPAGRLHDPDQRHAARRRVVRLLQEAQVPGRPERRRPARAARRLPRRQGRHGDLRRRDARLAVSATGMASTSTSCARSTPPTPTIRWRSIASSATS